MPLIFLKNRAISRNVRSGLPRRTNIASIAAAIACGMNSLISANRLSLYINGQGGCVRISLRTKAIKLKQSVSYST